MRDRTRRFRPMNIADILDETFELYRNNFVLFAGIAAIVIVPYSIIECLIGQRTPINPDPKAFGIYLLCVGLICAPLMLAYEIVTGVLTYAISQKYLGNNTDILTAYKRVLKPHTIFPFIGLIVMKWLAIMTPIAAVIFVAFAIGIATGFAGGGASMIGTVLLILLSLLIATVATVYVGVRLMLVQPAFMVEMKGAINALGRTWTLMKGYILKGLGVLIIAGIIASVVPGIILAPISMATSPAKFSPTSGFQLVTHQPSTALVIINMILSALAYTVTLPFTCIVSILFYFDTRIRKEGFDLEMLARELGETLPPNAAYGSATALPQEQLRTQYPQYPQNPPPPSDFEL